MKSREPLEVRGRRLSGENQMTIFGAKLTLPRSVWLRAEAEEPGLGCTVAQQVCRRGLPHPDGRSSFGLELRARTRGMRLGTGDRDSEMAAGCSWDGGWRMGDLGLSWGL